VGLTLAPSIGFTHHNPHHPTVVNGLLQRGDPQPVATRLAPAGAADVDVSSSLQLG
jgi:hypothetical protein